MIKLRVIKIAFLLISLLIVILIIFTASKRKTSHVPQTPIQPPNNYNYIGNRSGYKLNINFKEKNLDFPKTLSAYKTENNSADMEFSPENIANKLGLNAKPYVNDDPTFGKTYLFSNDNQYLRIVPEKRIIEYKTSNFSENTFDGPIDHGLIESKAWSFLSDLSSYLDTSSYFISSEQSVLVDTYGHIDENSGVYNVTTIVFNKKINNYPIHSSAYGIGVSKITFNDKYEVLSASINETPPLMLVDNYPIKTYSQLINSLNTNIPSLVYLNDGKTSTLDVDYNEVSTIDLDSVDIIYYQENMISNNFVQPMFRIYGKIIFKDGSEMTAIFITPAIQEGFLTE